MACSTKEVKFDPTTVQDDLLEDFNEFISQFRYTYEALNRDPPSSITEEAQKRAWVE